jgi:hypothetical protein
MTDGRWLARACSAPRHGQAPRQAGRAWLVRTELEEPVGSGGGADSAVLCVAVPPRGTPRHRARALQDHVRLCDVRD